MPKSKSNIPKGSIELFSLEGKKWYILEDTKAYPSERFLEALNEIQGFSLNFTRDSLKALLEKQIEVLTAVVDGGDHPVMRKNALDPIIKANKEAVVRIDSMTLPRVACRVLAWLIFNDEDGINTLPAATEVVRLSNLFWDKKKVKMLDLIFCRPFTTFAKHSELAGFDSVDSLKQGMMINQKIADMRNPNQIAD